MRSKDGTIEHAEISIELDPKDHEEEAFAKAKRIVKKELAPEPLKATIGEMLKGKIHG